MSTSKVIWSIVICTAVIELLTVILRFGFKLEAAHSPVSTIGLFTGGIRIHHGYVGAVLSLASLFLMRSHTALAQYILIAGMSLFLSDLIHHFLVLWIVVGSPEFHLTYPKPNTGQNVLQ
jgi:hypothetical protein